MSKPWGNIGNWAAESERAEEEERAEAEAAAAAAKAAPAPVESQSFPSLKEAVSTKTKKKKMTLSEFTMGSYSSPSASVGGGGGGRLTTDEMFQLPTGPKQRSADEMQYSGRGFSNYGRSGPPPSRMRDDSDGSWGGGGGGGGGRRSYGGFDERGGGPASSRVSDFDQPSRADEVDNWALGKKPLPSYDSGRQNQNQNQNRYGSLGGGSRADEVDNWTAGKKPIQARSSSSSSNFGFGSGFRDSGPEPDRWVRGGGGGGGGLRELERERPKLVLDPPKGETGLSSEPVKTNRPNPFGAARPREEVLAEKGLDWKKMDSDIDAKKTTSRPTSAHSSRPSSAHSNRSEGVENVVKARPKVNPFGDAKPREVLLEERGQDWRKIDLQLDHRRVDRPETEEEKKLKEEIDYLKNELEKEFTTKANSESLQGSGGDQPSIHDTILEREKDLEMLIHDLDDKVRFGQKAIERPGSGAGRAAGFSERPPSQSGSFEESRSMEFMDRPRSRGTGDVWTRPVDDRRAFQGGRERGFLGSRDLDRSRSRERW